MGYRSPGRRYWATKEKSDHPWYDPREAPIGSVIIYIWIFAILAFIGLVFVWVIASLLGLK